MLLSLLPTQVKQKMCSSFFIVTCSEMQAKFCLFLGVQLLLRRAAFLSFSYSRRGLQNILSSEEVSCPLACEKPYHMLHCTETWKLGLCTMGIVAVRGASKYVGKCIYETSVRTIFLFALPYVGVVKNICFTIYRYSKEGQ